MGNRRQIKITECEGAPSIYFYTHWDGDELHNILAKALKRGESRWGDPSYLNRIIFSEMINGDTKGLTGYGISTGDTYSNRPDILVSIEKQIVVLDGHVYTFKEFAERPAIVEA